MDIPIPVLGALIVIGLIIGVVFAVGLTKKWGILMPFAGMVLFSSMALPLSWNDRINPTVWLSIQSIRSQLYLASGVAATLVVLFQFQRLRGKSISISAALLVCIGLYASLLRFVHGGATDGSFSVIFSLFTAIPLAAAAAMVINEVEDLRLIFRSVALINLAWVGMVLVQVAVNPKYVTQGNQYRFVGLLSNPQHTGVLMAFLCVIILWLLLNDFRKYKIIYIGLLSINAIFLLWTGSRTGLGMTIIGISAVLYSRAGRAILLLPAVGILGYISMQVMVNVVGMDLGFDRMTSTENTRSDAWKLLIQSAQQNPLTGVGMDEMDRSENSWLYGYATYGIGMLVLLLAMTLVSTIEILKSVKARFATPPEYRPYLDVLVGIMLMYFAGAVLEGYMISRVSVTLCVFLVASVALVNIRKLANHNYDYSYEEHTDDYSSEEYTDQYTDHDTQSVS